MSLLNAESYVPGFRLISTFGLRPVSQRNKWAAQFVLRYFLPRNVPQQMFPGIVLLISRTLEHFRFSLKNLENKISKTISAHMNRKEEIEPCTILTFR